MIMYMLKNRLKSKSNTEVNESGFASIVIALILIIVLGLLTVGFAQLARNEQQQSLASQLANQAYDAAESGIHDAEAEVNNGSIDLTNSNDGKTCVDTNLLNEQYPTQTFKSTLNNGNGVSYPCVLVNLEPGGVREDLAPLTDQYLVFSTVQNNGTVSASSFTVYWGCDTTVSSASCSSDDGTTFPADTSGGLLKGNEWTAHKYQPLIQLSLTPLPAGGFNRSDLINNNYTAFLYPTTTLDTGGYSFTSGTGNTNTTNDIDGGNNPIVASSCSTSYIAQYGYPCQTRLSGFTPESQFLVHVTDYYQASKVYIVPNNSDNQAIDTAGGQAIIDSTGQAHNVLKRIQVVTPIGLNSTNISRPADALDGQNICKRLQTQPYLTNADTTGVTNTEACTP
jgi:Tfp pilus assembly protein PilX